MSGVSVGLVMDRGPEDALVLALDQGTTNTKALLVRPATGDIVSSSSRAVDLEFPSPGYVQFDAELLWESARGAIVEAASGVDCHRLAAIAVSNQRESVIAWDRHSGKPFGPGLGWQDARTSDWCATLSARQEVATEVQRRTGLSLDPMFSAPKLRWLLDKAIGDGAAAADVLLGTVDSWLIWRLTGGHFIEVGNASRTLLLNLHSLTWDPDLLALFGLPASSLPEVRGSDGEFGRTIAAPGLPAGIPIAAVLADSHAALFRHSMNKPGIAKATYGTGSSVMMLCQRSMETPAGISTTVAWTVHGTAAYAREGNIIASGAALDWTAKMLGAPEGTPGGAFLTALAADVPDAGGVSFVPAFAGLGAPYWDREAAGLLTGLTAGSSRAHIARAALDAVAHQVADVVEAMESDGLTTASVLHADGGASASGPLMQIQADLLGRPVEVASDPEASALGVAMLAAQTLGMAVAEQRPGRLLQPKGSRPPQERVAWKQAIARSRGLRLLAEDPKAEPDNTPQIKPRQEKAQ
ncbi:FGGY-family carbohydrate kinase [Acidothermaceae bacterium B102]|nr:FGGY-family carbohydrate kinase [Acidothermaceae bacterium B102]